MTIAALNRLLDRTDPRPSPPQLPAGGSTVDTATAVAVSMYKTGEPVAAIIEATGLTQDQVGAAVTSAGTPFVADRGQPPATPGLAAAELITWGMRQPAGRMQRLAETARVALADLQHAKRQAEVVAAAEAQVRAAKERLATAEQALRTAKSGSSAPSSSTSDPAENKLIRAWARERGHHVAVGGIIPRHIVNAYHQEQVGEADRAA